MRRNGGKVTGIEESVRGPLTDRCVATQLSSRTRCGRWTSSSTPPSMINQMDALIKAHDPQLGGSYCSSHDAPYALHHPVAAPGDALALALPSDAIASSHRCTKAPKTLCIACLPRVSRLSRASTCNERGGARVLNVPRSDMITPSPIPR